MKRYSLLFSALSLLIVFSLACASSNTEKDYYVKLTTTKGDIKIRLYNDTPVHRDNFIKLVKEKFYDGVLFHRVIKDFMIQAGDPSTKGDTSTAFIETYSYTIPAEINDSHFHKKGVIAAARTADRFNPERRSSGTQLYIVQGMVFKDTITEAGDTIIADELLDNIQQRVDASLKQAVFYKHLYAERKRVVDSGENKSDAEIQEFATMVAYDEIEEMEPYIISEERRNFYKLYGGTPHLDMQYTVFGEVVGGLDIVDLIADVETNPLDNKPFEDVGIIKARVVRK